MGTEGRGRVLTLMEPWFGLTESNEARQVRWVLADDDGNGFLVSWVERAFDSGMPECMAFPASVRDGEPEEVDWGHVAVSHEPDAAEALEDVLWQVRRLYGVGLVEHGALALCRPGRWSPMASEQRLPYLPKADVVVLADGSRHVRSRTCHVVKLHGCNEYDNCYSCSACNYGWHMSRYNRPYRFCPNCGARIVDEKEE